jgi:hypothetical protein
MASSFSEGERVRLFTLSLPESFQFFSVGVCSHWLVRSAVAPGTFLPQAFHRLRCLTWVQFATNRLIRVTSGSAPIADVNLGRSHAKPCGPNGPHSNRFSKIER